MLQATIHALKDFILSKNTYFDKGLELEFNRPEDELHLTDALGNYFYLRLPNNGTFIQGAEYTVAECSPGLGASAAVVLVAYVERGNSDLLITNLVNTLQLFKGARVSFTGFIYSRETVIRTEMAGYAKENIDRALATIEKSTALVSVSFTITAPVILNRCIVNPCEQC